MMTRIVRVQDMSKDDEGAWRRLSERALEPNPYFEPDFLLLSSRHLAGHADIKLVIAQEGTEFKGVLPISRISKSRMPPGRVASTRCSPGFAALLDTPLIDRSRPDQASGALLDALREAAKSEDLPGIVMFNQIAADGPVIDSLRRVCRERRCPIFVKESWERGSVSRTGRWTHPVDGKRGREIARRRRSLEKVAGVDVMLVDRTSDPAALEDFLTMESSGWKGRGGGKAFTRSSEQEAWFRAWHRCWVDAGRLHVLALNVGSASIAMQYFVRAGEGLFCIRIAFDEAYAKFGPGAILLVSALSHLRDNTDAAWLDSSADPNNAFFLGIMPERRTLSRLLIGTGGVWERNLVSALPTMTRVVAAEKQVRKRLTRTRST